MAQAPLIDRHFLERLERLTLQWQKSFPGLVGGHNPSRFSGPGQEFFDHRNFHAGDDLRAVNWRAYLRLDKLFLKMFQIEPRVPVRLLLDASNSMSTGGAKFDYARRLAGALTYVGLVRLDTICVQPFRDTLVEACLCGGGRHRFRPAAEFLQDLEPRGKTNFLEVARQFLSQYPQRGLLIIISDFLGDEDCLKPLQYLADFGHELSLIQLWSEEDREPQGDGEFDLIDAETGNRLQISLDAEARGRYTGAFDEYAAQIRHLAQRNGGRYAGLPTTQPLEEAVFGPLIRSGGVA